MSIHASLRLSAQVEDALAKAEAAPAPATGEVVTPVDAEMKQTSYTSKSAEPGPSQATQTAALPPRKLKLQPGDFYITLPKPPSAVPNAPGSESVPQPSEHNGPEANSAGPEVETSGEQHIAKGLSAPEREEASKPGQAAETSGSGEHQHLDSLLQKSCERTFIGTETQPDSSAALTPGHTSATGAADVPGPASSSASGGGPGAWQHSIPSNAETVLQPFPENYSTPGNRYGASAARKEEAQELALEQAILVRYSLQLIFLTSPQLKPPAPEGVCRAACPPAGGRDQQLSSCGAFRAGGSSKAC